MHALRFSFVLTAVIAGSPSLVLAGDPSRDPDAMTTTSRSPSSSVATSSDDSLARSESPDDDVAESESSDDLVESAASPDDPGAVRGTPMPPKPLAKPASCKAPAGDGGWSACLEEASGQIASARQRLAAAEAAYARSVNFRDDRGSARAKIIAEREQAQSDLAAAEERLPDLVEDARRADVSPRVLDPYLD